MFCFSPDWHGDKNSDLYDEQHYPDRFWEDVMYENGNPQKKEKAVNPSRPRIET